MLHDFQNDSYRQTYALLTHVDTRFSSRHIMGKSVLRTKSALVNCVMSERWKQETNYRGVDQAVKREAATTKKYIMDTANWLKGAALLKFLEPLVRLAALMGTDDGHVLSFFYIAIIGISKIWDSQPNPRDTSEGYAGVKHGFALAANKALWDKWQKHEHPLQGTAALMNPYNHCPLQKVEPLYAHLKPGDVPAESVMLSLEEEFTTFIEKYVRNSGVIAELQDCLTSLKGREVGTHFKAHAFDPSTIEKYKNNPFRWYQVYCKCAPMVALASRVLRCKPSSSSSERNWSIFGIVHSKLRNRLALNKAIMLVYIYQNLRAIRKFRGEATWMPNVNFCESPEEPEVLEFDVEELAAFWDEFIAEASNFQAVSHLDDDDDDGGDDDDDDDLFLGRGRRPPPQHRTPAEERQENRSRHRRRRILDDNNDSNNDDDDQT